MRCRCVICFTMRYSMSIRLMKSLRNTARARKCPKQRLNISQVSKTDRILPIITLTLYFGADEWDAPRDLHSMLSANEDILKFVDNYHLHLIAPAEMADEEFTKFHTELSLALKYVKYSKDKKRFREMISEDTAFKSVSRKTADMVNVVTNSNLHYNDGEERVDMCEAIEEIRNDAKEEGILETLIGLVKDGILTIADVAKRADMTVPEFEEKTGLKA